MNKPTIKLWADRSYGCTYWKPHPECKVSQALFAIMGKPLLNEHHAYLAQMGFDIIRCGDIKHVLKEGT